MNWSVIFYRNASGKCYIEKFVEDLSVEDAEEVVASIAALKELGNKARRPLADYLEDEIYELRARRLKKQFRLLYTFVGRQTILLLTGFVKKSKAVPFQRLSLNWAIFYSICADRVKNRSVNGVYVWPLLLISQDSRGHRSLRIKIKNQSARQSSTLLMREGRPNGLFSTLPIFFWSQGWQDFHYKLC